MTPKAQLALEAPAKSTAIIQLPRPQPTALLDSLRRPLCGAGLILSDLLTVAVSLQFALLVRNYLLPIFLTEASTQSPFSFSHYLQLWWLWLLFPLIFAMLGLYTKRSTVWTETLGTVKGVSLGSISIMAVVALGRYGPQVSRATLLLTGLLLFLLMPVSRVLAKRLLFELNLWKKPVLILGAAKTGQLAFRALTEDPVLGYFVVGHLDDDPAKHGQTISTPQGKRSTVLGPISLARQLLEQRSARDVILAMPGLAEQRMVVLIQELQGLCETMRVVPRIMGIPMMSLHLDYFLDARFFTLNVTNNLGKDWNQWIKRIFDLVLGTLILLLSAPVLLLLAALIVLDSRGPALFRQPRLGRHGKTFRCWKLRTMKENADVILETFLKNNPHQRHDWEKYAKLKSSDPRITRIGRALRRWSLDELPQIINVLKGEMSIVGPRPYLPRELQQIGAHMKIISQARPGMTGLWQVSGRNDLSFEERVSLEAWYIRNWSLWLDFIILAKTINAVFLRKGTAA
jgi:undecaprenyl-phosphate galactose phosphotransferase